MKYRGNHIYRVLKQMVVRENERIRERWKERNMFRESSDWKKQQYQKMNPDQILKSKRDHIQLVIKTWHHKDVGSYPAQK